MKTTFFLPLLLGSVLAGCSSTGSDTKKVSARGATDASEARAFEANANSPIPSVADQSHVTAVPSVVPTPSAGPALTTTPILPPSASPEPVVAVNDFKPAMADRITEWKLTPADIKDELQTSGRIVRSRTPGAGEPTGPMDAILASSINSKLREDADTAALKIAVEANQGVVTLTGYAQSPEQLGHIIALSLDTGGVTQVVSLIRLETAP